MHRLERPAAPQKFTDDVTDFLSTDPAAVNASGNRRWKAFRDTQRTAYTEARNALEANQHGLCAYCEIKLSENNRQIEHFQPKGSSTAQHDWTLDFSNFLLCCKGGTNNQGARTNHSCGEKKGDAIPDDCCLNPYNLPDYPLFTLALSDDGIALAVDREACRRAGIAANMAQSTLDCLGLNCLRLCQRRQAVYKVLDDEIAQAHSLPLAQQKNELQSMAEAYLMPPSEFYTTKLLFLADYLPDIITMSKK
ncbi:MAG: TIGR02646 family protein [Candidatus Adiutrix sp.]|nr:TIGR02646 family protein [Candidatus Adiutrix sp.]